LSGEILTRSIDAAHAHFNNHFDSTFALSAKKMSEDQKAFAKAAFSNLIGGMGFFYGNSIIQFPKFDGPALGTAHALYTAVPSRPFFPRGFLWDEGFHELLISQWSADISYAYNLVNTYLLRMDVLKHWFNLMDHGWIPREQILGDEARSKVPPEFTVQYPSYANPPTLLMVVEKINQQLARLPVGSVEAEKYKSFLQTIYPKVEDFFKWFERTQSGVLPNSFRWRGRTENHTLTSGIIEEISFMNTTSYSKYYI
jgi:mannosyl-oligosaccharide glucosidase